MNDKNKEDTFAAFVSYLMIGLLIFLLGMWYGTHTEAQQKSKITEKEIVSMIIEKGHEECINSRIYLSFPNGDESILIPLFDENGGIAHCEKNSNTEKGE